MKIIYFFKQYNTPMYTWQNQHIIDELKHHNVDVLVFNPLDYDSTEIANEELIKHLKNNRYDLFMTCQNEECLYIETIKRIKQMSLPTMLICFDSLMTPLKHKKVAGLFDVVLISQEDVDGYFRKYNSNTIVSHYAANPYFFKPDYGAEKINRMCFPGTPYGSRAHIINTLAVDDIPIDLYYNYKGTPNNNPSQPEVSASVAATAKTLLKHRIGRKVIMGALLEKIKGPEPVNVNLPSIFLHDGVNLAETNKIFSSHDLSLSVSIGRNSGNLKNPIQIVHLRNFEIPMSGGVQFCQYFDELASCFEEDKEIIFYRTQEEMCEKAKFYLREDNENIRQKIRVAARTRAENEHTWFCRFSKAFDNLGLDY